MAKQVRKSRKNIYRHAIDLRPLKIKNSPRDAFRKVIEQIEYRGYEVEQLGDGRKIVITKPGGKFVYGTLRREDFMVWIYDEREDSLWLISHRNIYEDLVEKGQISATETVKIINALERVYNGKEPNEILTKMKIENPCGESPETLLKTYKWIWGQEDCNYPTGEGRRMSMKEIIKLRDSLEQKAKGEFGEDRVG